MSKRLQECSPTTLLNMFKKADASALKGLEVAGFDECSTRLEHMKSAHEALGDNPEVPKVLDLGGKI